MSMTYLDEMLLARGIPICEFDKIELQVQSLCQVFMKS